MPLDASIYGQIQQPQVTNPLNALSQVAQIQHFQGANRLADLTYGEKQRDIAGDSALAGLLAKGGKPEDIALGLAQQGYGTKSLAYTKQQNDLLKQQTDIGKTKADTAKTTDETAIKRGETIANTLGALSTVPNVSAQHVSTAMQHLVDIGAIQPELAQKIIAGAPQDPSQMQLFLKTGRDAFISAKDQALQVETNRHNTTTEKQTAKRDAATDARARETFNAPQYMETDAGLVALPKKLAPGQVPTGTPVMGANGEALGKPLKPIPPSVNTAIINNSQSLNQIDRALTLLDGKNIGDPTKGGMQGDASATGVKGYLPNGVLNRIDPKGVAARAEISDIGSLKIHDRSGAAVTISESPRLMPFIPLATDDAVTAKKKLTRLQLELKNESAALAETYSKEQGYRPSPVNRAPTSRAPDAKAGGVVDFGDLK